MKYFFVNSKTGEKSGEMKVKVDTLFVYDTLLLPVSITDTLMLHDTVLVQN